jgi:hypothetical protein
MCIREASGGLTLFSFSFSFFLGGEEVCSDDFFSSGEEVCSDDFFSSGEEVCSDDFYSSGEEVCSNDFFSSGRRCPTPDKCFGMSLRVHANVPIAKRGFRVFGRANRIEMGGKSVKRAQSLTIGRKASWCRRPKTTREDLSKTRVGAHHGATFVRAGNEVRLRNRHDHFRGGGGC